MTAKDASSHGAKAATATASPAPTNVQVIAPATLQAGYTFDAMYEGVTFTVAVPAGGVTKGQRFIVPFTPPAGEDAVAVAVPAGDGDDVPANTAKSKGGAGGGGGGAGIPTGIWRDGLCECLRFGCCHPHFLNALFFRPCLMGQVMTRMKMTWMGRRLHGNATGNDEVDRAWKETFRKMAIATAVFYSIFMLSAPESVLNSWITSLFGSYMFYILIQLRATIRSVYSIPEESCLSWYQLGIFGTNPHEGIVCPAFVPNETVCTANVPVGWEDVCCSLWCQVCVVAQMARHTVDYGQKDAVCCNDTGVTEWEEDEAYDGVEAGVGEGSVLVV
jgi:hypothetical protein